MLGLLVIVSGVSLPGLSCLCRCVCWQHRNVTSASPRRLGFLGGTEMLSIWTCFWLCSSFYTHLALGQAVQAAAGLFLAQEGGCIRVSVRFPGLQFAQLWINNGSFRCKGRVSKLPLGLGLFPSQSDASRDKLCWRQVRNAEQTEQGEGTQSSLPATSTTPSRLPGVSLLGLWLEPLGPCPQSRDLQSLHIQPCARKEQQAWSLGLVP